MLSYCKNKCQKLFITYDQLTAKNNMKYGLLVLLGVVAVPLTPNISNVVLSSTFEKVKTFDANYVLEKQVEKLLHLRVAHLDHDFELSPNCQNSIDAIIIATLAK